MTCGVRIDLTLQILNVPPLQIPTPNPGPQHFPTSWPRNGDTRQIPGVVPVPKIFIGGSREEAANVADEQQGTLPTENTRDGDLGLYGRFYFWIRYRSDLRFSGDARLPESLRRYDRSRYGQSCV